MEANTSTVHTSSLDSILDAQFGSPATRLTVVADMPKIAQLATELTPAPVRDWSVETIDNAGAARAARDEATCKTLGLALPPAFFALGTTLVDIGVDNARLAREEFEALPFAVDAMQALEAEVLAEDRKPLTVDLQAVKLTTAGELACKANPAAVDPIKQAGFRMGAEEDCMRQLSQRMRSALDAGGDLGVVTGLKLGELESIEQAARTWNNYGGILARREAKTGENQSVVLRTRMVEQKGGARRRQVYAVTSEKYGEVDTHKIAAACRELAAGIDGDVRAQVVYDRRGVSIDLLTHTTVTPDAQVVGDVFRAGLSIRSDDTGGGSLRVCKRAYRVACRNYTTVSADGAVTVIRHLGDASKLLEKLRAAVMSASDILRVFAAQWTTACSKAAEQKMIRELETDRTHRADLASLVDNLLEGKAYRREQDELLDGIYRSVLARGDLAPKADLEDQVVALRAAHYAPSNRGGAREFSPAAISNGLTLWAQSRGRHDADKIEAVAGRIISGDDALAWLAAAKKV